MMRRPAIAALALSVLFLLLLPSIAGGVSSSATWEQMLPLTTAQPLKGVTFVSASTGWAVGGAGVVLRTCDGGRSWRRVSVPLLHDALYDAAFTSTAHGWVVGQHGAIVRTVDGGYTWDSVLRPVTNTLLAVSAYSSRTLVAVGEHGTIVRTTDGGAHWSKRTSPSPSSLTDVRFFSAEIVVAVTDRGSILRSTNAGKTWAYARKRSSKSYGVYFDHHYRSSVDSVSGSRGWVTGPQGVLKTTNGGRTWTRVSNRGRLEAVDFVTSLTGYAILNAWWDEYPPSTAYAIYKTTDGGRNWKRVYYGGPESGSTAIGQLVGIRCTKSQQCVVGAGGTIVLSLDGTHWSEASSPMPVLHDLSFTTAAEGWAVRQQLFNDGERVGAIPGYSRSLLKTTDAGATWAEVPLPDSRLGEWAVFSSATNGWLSGFEDNPSKLGTVYSTADGGSSWTTSTAIAGRPFFIDSQHGWAPGAGSSVARTTDGGQTWASIPVTLGSAPIGYSGPPFAPIREVAFATEDLGWLLGYGRIYMTTDGGDTWTLQHIEDSNLLFHLRVLSPTAAWADGYLVREVYVATADTGANWGIVSQGTYEHIVAAFPTQGLLFRLDETGRYGFTLNKSTDGGITWAGETISPFDPVGFNYQSMPTHLFMADPEDAWLYGNNGQLSRRFPTAVLGNPECAATASVGETIAVSGTFGSDAAELGGVVQLRLWRQSGSDWLLSGTATATVGGAGSYLGTVSLPQAGTWRLRAYHAADVHHNSSASADSTMIVVSATP